MIFTRAIVRRPGRSLTEGITTAGLGQPDYDLALRQHDAYIAALESCGLAITVLEADENYADGMFVEDTALVMPGLAIVTRPGADSRRGEIDSIRDCLSGFYDHIEQVEAPGTVDAGDIMMVGRHFYVGLSERTNENGAEQLIAHLRCHGFDGSTIGIGQGLHLKSSVSYLEHNRILVTEELVDSKELAGFESIVVARENAYSANSLWVNGSVLVPSGFADTRDAVAHHGYAVIELDVSEFRKLDGGLSCLSLRF